MLRRAEHLLEALDARLNPLMVKEAQQSFRNRALLIIGMLVLGVPLLILMGTLASKTVTGFSADRSGDVFFRTLSGFAVLVTWIALPARAAAQFHGEVRSRTIDLTVLTSLTPWQLASGRFQAAVLQIVLLLSFLAPFAVASIALGGIDAARVLTAWVVIFAVGSLQCAAALLAVTGVSLAPRLLALFALLGVGELFFVFSLGIALATNAPSGGEIAALLWVIGMFVLCTLFFLRLTADMLIPGGMRSYARSKLLLVAILVAFLGVTMLAPFLPITSGDADAVVYTSTFWVTTFGLFWCGADRRPGSGGRLGVLLEDGPESTVMFVSFLVTAIAVLAQLRGWDTSVPVAFLVYFVFFVGSAKLLQALWFTANGEGFFVALLVVLVIELVATFALFANSGWNRVDTPSPATVLLPWVWAIEKDRVLNVLSAFPLIFGVLALMLARRLQLKRAYG